MILGLLVSVLQQSAQANSLLPAVDRDLFGVFIDRAGDLDGDGVEEIWIGDPSRPVGSKQYTGTAWAVSTKTGRTVRRVACPDGAMDFGWTLAKIDDVDEDAVPDFAVSAQLVGSRSDLWETLHDYPPSGQAAVYLYSGKSGGLVRSWTGPADCPKIPWYSAGAGPSLVCVGDWNKDGCGDIAIGWSFADSEDGKLPDTGRVEVVSGKDGSRLRSWYGADAHDRFGFAIAAPPDLDQDGMRELAASAVPDYGAPEGEPAHPNLSKIRPGYVWILSSKGERLRQIPNPEEDRRFGFSLRWLGTGVPGMHLAIGQAHYGEHEPCAWIEDGGDDKRSARIGFPGVEKWYGVMPNWTPPPTGPNDSFGSQLLELRDSDSDGARDLLVTMPQAFCDVPAAVLSRKTGAVLARVRLPDGKALSTHVGNSLVDLPDVDGDGIEDFAIGGASVRCFECEGLVLIASGKDASPIRKILRSQLLR